MKRVYCEPLPMPKKSIKKKTTKNNPKPTYSYALKDTSSHSTEGDFFPLHCIQ